ncbi:hypothetical protein LCGC14_1595480 [marine sediment metagenome]|uniref:Uncharacterized protein n=1 Tax=marine sediment metagenome TaxID=412755 RepID=A0A0F9ICS1_9ZZZZ
MDVSEREELWDDIARLEDANTELQAENEKLKEKVKVLELAQDLTQYTKEQLQENETLHKKLRILRNAKCPKCQHRFKIQKLS